ncbi:MAG: helix-turn-helix domain-containing protein [Actinomycetota bacterium]|nr:helix-turn-helix domain-containing protein [Actinomycetota bacterium]
MHQKYLTLDEAAELANINKSYIYRLSYEGRLPGKVSWGKRTVRVDREIFENWLKAQASASDSN